MLMLWACAVDFSGDLFFDDVIVLVWWVVDAGITMEVTRRRVLGLLGRMLRVRTLSALEAGVVASGTPSVM